MPNKVGNSPTLGPTVEYEQPEPPQTPESLDGVADSEEKQRHFYAALAHLATDACLKPDSLAQTRERIDVALTVHFRPRKGMPTRADASNTIWLAGAMGATNVLLANHAYEVMGNDVSDGKTPPAFAPPRYYFVEAFNPSDPPQVILYDEGTPEDLHMRAVVKALVDAAIDIEELSVLPGNKYSLYLPVFQMEQGIRESLPQEPIRGSHQLMVDEVSPNPLDPERVRIAASQFARNVMHGIILLTDGQPRDDRGALRSLVRENVPAFEIAALHRRDHQRACMGIPGEPYESIRREKHITPQVVRVGNDLRFRRLEKIPHVESMCSGAGSHYVPAQYCSPVFGPKYPVSAISKHVDLALKVVPFTLFSDIPRYTPR